MDGAKHNRRIWFELLNQAIAVGGLLLSLKFAMQYLDPYKEQREQARKRSAFLKKQLGRSIDLNEYEQLLAANVMNPEHIDVSMDDVSGLDDIVRELEEKVLYPLNHPEVYRTTLWKQTKGVLFYGPPGTGKTMLAKALAKQSGCFFLNITTSSILSKWLGDASRLVRAVFTLAHKLQPCIIFIDEVDAMLSRRGSSSEHEATLQVKTEFMQLWDGMESLKGTRIVVMGATNRPNQVDEAVLRRFTCQYEIGLPTQQQRVSILRSYLRRHNKEAGEGAVSSQLLRNLPDPDTGGAGALDWIASRTDGYSGSDLMELAAQAAQHVLGEFWEAQRGRQRLGATSTSTSTSGSGIDYTITTRPVERRDFQAALRSVRPPTERAMQYQRQLHMGEGLLPSMSPQELSMMMQMMMQMAAGKAHDGASGGGESGQGSGADGGAGGDGKRK